MDSSHNPQAASPTDRPEFPCAAVPEEGRRARLLGLYNQRQPGLLMQRIKITGGRLTPAQWRRIAELALRLTPEEPLRLTTRQDIEFHGLRPEDAPALQRGLDEVGLSTVGACGDTVRAVTVDPESGLVPGSYDLGALARLIHDYAQTLPDAFALPRKFKVSLSGSPMGKARPYINDVGLVANEDGTLRAIGAGSLGARPNPGIVLYDRLAPGEVLPLIVAVLRLFAVEGDRANRSRARLRHVRERLGDEAFRQALEELFAEEREKPHPTVPALVRGVDAVRPVVRLSLPEGVLIPRDALTLAELAERRQAVPRIGLEHDLWIFGLDFEDLPERMRGWAAAPPVIACPGAHLCQRGVAPTWEAAAALRAAIPGGSGLLAGISGCPNNCAHAAVADIGLLGRLKTLDGEQRPHYRLLAGGGRGETAALALELHGAVPQDRLGAAAAWLIGQWNEARQAGEIPFASFVARERERLSAGLKALVENPPPLP